MNISKSEEEQKVDILEICNIKDKDEELLKTKIDTSYTITLNDNINNTASIINQEKYIKDNNIINIRDNNSLQNIVEPYLQKVENLPICTTTTTTIYKDTYKKNLPVPTINTNENHNPNLNIDNIENILLYKETTPKASIDETKEIIHRLSNSKTKENTIISNLPLYSREGDKIINIIEEKDNNSNTNSTVDINNNNNTNSTVDINNNNTNDIVDINKNNIIGTVDINNNNINDEAYIKSNNNNVELNINKRDDIKDNIKTHNKPKDIDTIIDTQYIDKKLQKINYTQPRILNLGKFGTKILSIDECKNSTFKELYLNTVNSLTNITNANVNTCISSTVNEMKDSREHINDNIENSTIYTPNKIKNVTKNTIINDTNKVINTTDKTPYIQRTNAIKTLPLYNNYIDTPISYLKDNKYIKNNTIITPIRPETLIPNNNNNNNVNNNLINNSSYTSSAIPTTPYYNYKLSKTNDHTNKYLQTASIFLSRKYHSLPKNLPINTLRDYLPNPAAIEALVKGPINLEPRENFLQADICDKNTINLETKNIEAIIDEKSIATTIINNDNNTIKQDTKNIKPSMKRIRDRFGDWIDVPITPVKKNSLYNKLSNTDTIIDNNKQLNSRKQYLFNTISKTPTCIKNTNKQNFIESKISKTICPISRTKSYTKTIESNITNKESKEKFDDIITNTTNIKKRSTQTPRVYNIFVPTIKRNMLKKNTNNEICNKPSTINKNIHNASLSSKLYIQKRYKKMVLKNCTNVAKEKEQEKVQEKGKEKEQEKVQEKEKEKEIKINPITRSIKLQEKPITNLKYNHDAIVQSRVKILQLEKEKDRLRTIKKKEMQQFKRSKISSHNKDDKNIQNVITTKDDTSAITNSAINRNISSAVNKNINSAVNKNINSAVNKNINSAVNKNINSAVNKNINSAVNKKDIVLKLEKKNFNNIQDKKNEIIRRKLIYKNEYNNTLRNYTITPKNKIENINAVVNTVSDNDNNTDVTIKYNNNTPLSAIHMRKKNKVDTDTKKQDNRYSLVIPQPAIHPLDITSLLSNCILQDDAIDNNNDIHKESENDKLKQPYKKINITDENIDTNSSNILLQTHINKKETSIIEPIFDNKNSLQLKNTIPNVKNKRRQSLQANKQYNSTIAIKSRQSTQLKVLHRRKARTIQKLIKPQ